VRKEDQKGWRYMVNILGVADQKDALETMERLRVVLVQYVDEDTGIVELHYDQDNPDGPSIIAVTDSESFEDREEFLEWLVESLGIELVETKAEVEEFYDMTHGIFSQDEIVEPRTVGEFISFLQETFKGRMDEVLDMKAVTFDQDDNPMMWPIPFCVPTTDNPQLEDKTGIMFVLPLHPIENFHPGLGDQVYAVTKEVCPGCSEKAGVPVEHWGVSLTRDKEGNPEPLTINSVSLTASLNPDSIPPLDIMLETVTTFGMEDVELCPHCQIYATEEEADNEVDRRNAEEDLDDICTHGGNDKVH